MHCSMHYGLAYTMIVEGNALRNDTHCIMACILLRHGIHCGMWIALCYVECNVACRFASCDVDCNVVCGMHCGMRGVVYIAL